MESLSNENEIKSSEYNYLLIMPIWSLTEEKVIELTEDLKNKLRESEELKATQITTLWDNDLKVFLEALQVQEEKDEADRLSHKATANNGKQKKRRAKAINKKQGDEN